MHFFAMLSLELSHYLIHDIIKIAYLVMWLLIALVVVLFLILAAVNLVKMAKTTNSSKHLRSETKNRFYLRFIKPTQKLIPTMHLFQILDGRSTAWNLAG